MVNILGISKDGFHESHFRELESIFAQKINFFNQVGMASVFPEKDYRSIDVFAFKAREFDDVVIALLNSEGPEMLVAFIQQGPTDQAKDGVWAQVLSYNKDRDEFTYQLL